MPVTFIPEARALFVHGDPAALGAASRLAEAGSPADADLVGPSGKRSRTTGRSVPMLAAIETLAPIAATAIGAMKSASAATWCLASKLALDLAVRERLVPLVREGEARWAAALEPGDEATVTSLARSMPPAAHAVSGLEADVALRAFVDAAVDALARAAAKDAPATAARARAVPFVRALTTDDATLTRTGLAERSLADSLAEWTEPVLGRGGRPQAVFRLDLPRQERSPFLVRYLLRAADDPSLVVEAKDVWRAGGGGAARKLGAAFDDAEHALLRGLALGARLFAPIAASLSEPAPERLALDAQGAWAFLSVGAPRLAEAGFGVQVPGELTRSGRRRLRLRMRVGAAVETAGKVEGAPGVGIEDVLAFRWEAAMGDEALDARELALLAKHKAPLVRHRGAWVAIDPLELAEIQERLREAPGAMRVAEAMRAALAGTATASGREVDVVAEGELARALGRVREAASRGTAEAPPPLLQATLRPYQARGLGWLRTMASLGLGGCLADDMGLGKTIQTLAFLLSDAPATSDLPSLLVAPTSVVGNWEREIERFAPSLRVVRHYGAERARAPASLAGEGGALVVTTYGIARRDAPLLGAVAWSTLVLDEAQNVKNAASATARACRSIRARHRFALTGTPVENRLAELWSILEITTPGLLGPLETFRREIAVPVERYGSKAAAERLRRIVAPFVLRRTKSDPAIVPELPAKNEMKVVCTLTREQATLYRAVLDEEMRRIQESEGIQRRGRVLALVSYLKQICNHPAQYLGEPGPLAKRSGKLARVAEMLEEALSAGDRALVFTQFREMGDRLVAHLGATLGVEVAFLHGGTPKRARDEMVERFQADPDGPPIFVLSVKAGGTGLNLTAATHVFHYDRWWNPAVEDQATDRAHRIGQKRSVQVHKLVCAGTIEDRVDALLEKKRALASSVVQSGEQWITELGDRELRALFALADDAAIASADADDGAEEGAAA